MISHVMLIVTVMIVGNAPDKQSRVEVPTIEDCWKEAQAWVSSPMPKVRDANGLAATCAVYITEDSE